MIVLWLACSGDVETDASYVEADPMRLARRMSLDLRGELPSLETLQLVREHPAALDTLAWEYLEDAGFEDRFVSLMAEQWHTRLDVFEVQYYDYTNLTEADEYAFEKAVGEEPLRLLAHVAKSDLPWWEIVNASYTVANPLLASIWPLDYPDGAEGWQVSRYNDGRPGAGVLSTNGLWWRYVTNVSNLNRSRAAAVARLTVCVDLLARPVSLGDVEGLTDDGGTEAAIRTEPGCVACHAAVEPIAANFFGFWSPIQYSAIEYGQYHPERETVWEEFLESEPGWFGEPVEGLAEIGHAIANDERFSACAVEQAATALWRRAPTNDDFDVLQDLQQTFDADGMKMKTLLAAVTRTDAYRAVGTDDEDLQDAELGLRLLSPEAMASAVTALTGFTWTWEGYEQLSNDTYGYRVLAGGVDGEGVTRPQDLPGLTWGAVTRRFAQAAAHHAVTTELVDGGEREVFLQVSVDDRPGDAAFDAELEGLWLRLLAQDPSDEQLAELAGLWSDMYAVTDAATAWSAVLSSLLLDPLFLTT